jgi:hypothetical protein
MPERESLEKTVAAFLRDALAQRYSVENMRRYRAFDGLSDKQITQLRTFGLQYIYPEWEARCFQQRAFDALTELLGSPMRLKPLVAVAMKSLWRFGRQLPRAIEAGKEVLSAFEATQHLENTLIASLRDVNADRSALSKEDVVQGLAAVPPETFETFVRDMTALMQLLSERTLLDTGYSVLKDIGAAMDKRPEHYKDIERKGMHYALQVMDEGMALFDDLDDAVIEAAITAIPQVESDWYQRVTQP